MDGKAIGYLLIIGLAWCPWLLFNEKVLGGDRVFSGIGMLIPILIWFFSLAIFYGRSGSAALQSGIEIIVGKISIALLLLIMVPLLLANMVGIDFSW